MAPAAQQLQQQKWKDAIPNEQKALQFLLRAEATYRQIEVAFGSRGGGGGGGGAARDLASLFDLELDTEKNQYETRQPAATSAEQKAQEIADALKKLDELAKREEDLAQRQRDSAQTAEQKWQQEMLQREAQQLQQQMERQLAQNGHQDQQSQAGHQSQSGSASGQSGSGQSSGQARDSSDSRQQAAQQALDHLRQANDDMRRAVSRGASAADSRRAADRLRQATDLLGTMQQQDAGSRLNSMAKTADRLTAQQKQQADRVRDLLAQQNAARTSGKQMTYPSAREIDKMVDDRQQVTDELARLTQQMRGTARELAPTQPAASTRLRSALDSMDENDLGTRMQRSSDRLRSGSFSDPYEAALTSDLQKLGQQVGDAARALGSAQHTSKDAALNGAMDDLSRLRDQLAGLGSQPRPVGNRIADPTGNPAGGATDRDRNVLGAYDTGNTRISGRAVAPQQGANPADTQRQIDQGLNLLNQVRAVTQDSHEARQQLQSLIDQMRNLDPSRFPGNPALVDQMHQQLVSSLDALELQLRRQLDENHGSTIRNTDPAKVPAGYREAVAEYYRKLSGGSH
jgi:hypothetical protein